MEEKLGMVVSLFNSEITKKMSEIAEKRVKEVGAHIYKSIEVSGSYEIPLAVKRFLEQKDIQGVLTIGTIIKGGTDHDLVIAHSIAKTLLELSIKYDKPVSLGISGPNITWQQSEKRIEEYALRAVDSVIHSLRRGL